MRNLAERAVELRRALLLVGLADAAEPERAERPAMAEALPDLAAYLGDLPLRHWPKPPRLRRQLRRPPALLRAPRPSASSTGARRRSRGRAPSQRPRAGAAASAHRPSRAPC